MLEATTTNERLEYVGIISLRKFAIVMQIFRCGNHDKKI